MASDYHGFVIVGAGGLGHEVLSAWLAAGHSSDAFLGFVDPVAPDRARLDALGANWLGPDEVLHDLKAGTGVCVAIGNEATRRSVTGLVLEAGLVLVSVIDATATLGSTVSVGAGSILLMQSSATVHVHMGTGVLINPGVRIAHDCVIGDFSSLSPGAILCGNVTIGAGVFVGAGATVCPGVMVGAGATIGAGAVVLDDVAVDETVIGIPARPRGNTRNLAG